MKSSTSSSSTKGGKKSSSPASSSKESTSKASLQKTKSAQPSPPTTVKLKGVLSSFSHGDVVSAVEEFGKTKSVVLFRSRVEAIVCFEKEEDAKKLRSSKKIIMKGMPVVVIEDDDTGSEKTPQKKPAVSRNSTPQTIKSSPKKASPKETPAKPPSKPLVSPSETQKTQGTEPVSGETAAKSSNTAPQVLKKTGNVKVLENTTSAKPPKVKETTSSKEDREKRVEMVGEVEGGTAEPTDVLSTTASEDTHDGSKEADTKFQGSTVKIEGTELKQTVSDLKCEVVPSKSEKKEEESMEVEKTDKSRGSEDPPPTSSEKARPQNTGAPPEPLQMDVETPGDSLGSSRQDPKPESVSSETTKNPDPDSVNAEASLLSPPFGRGDDAESKSIAVGDKLQEKTLDSTTSPKVTEDMEVPAVEGLTTSKNNTVKRADAALTIQNDSTEESPDEQTFNLEDFVTVDEVGEDVGNANPDPHQPSSSKRISTKSLKVSSSSKSTDVSMKRNSKSVSPKSTRSQTRTSQPNKTKSLVKASKPPVLRTRSASAACTREIESAMTSELSVETPQATIAPFDHRVSAEATAFKTVESETKTGTSELQSLVGEQESDLGQTKNLEAGLDSVQDLEKPEKEDSIEAPVLLDTQTHRQMDDGNQSQSSDTQEPEPGVSSSQTFQVLDSIDDENHRPEDQGEDTNVKQASSLERPHGRIEVKDVDSDETFEIIDSVDTTEDESQTKDDLRHVEEEDDAYQVLDSVEDLPTTAEAESEADNKELKMEKVEMTTKKKTTRVSKRQEDKSQKKPDKTVKTTVQVSTKDQQSGDIAEETVYEILDYVEDEPAGSTARRRSARGKKGDLTESSKKTHLDQQPSNEVLDSVDDDNVAEETTVTTRLTRGRQVRATKKDTEKTKKEDASARGRQTPKKEDKPLKESEPTKSDIPVKEEVQEEATFEILDSVEDVFVKDEPRKTRGRGKRGRPKKTIKKEPVKVAVDEEVSYQVLDSLEETTVDQPKTPRKMRKSKNVKKPKLESTVVTELTTNEEDEPLYQIVDSVEDDQVQEESRTTEESTKEVSATEESTKEVSVTEESTKEVSLKEVSTTEVSAPEESAKESSAKESSANEVSAMEESANEVSANEVSTEVSTTETKEPAVEEDAPMISTPAVETSNEVVHDLEEVKDPSSTEEQFGFIKTSRTEQGTSTTMSRRKVEAPAEETNPELFQTNALVNLDEVSDEEEDYPEDTAEEEELWRRRADVAEEKPKRNISTNDGEEEEVDEKEQGTLDEVGPDEAAGEVTTGELQDLVTLDEILDEEEKVDDKSDKISRSAKRKHDDNSVEEPESFVTMDEVGEEGPSSRRPQPTKKTRKTNAKDEEELTPGSEEAPDEDPSTLQSEPQPEIQKTEEEGAGNASTSAPPSGQNQSSLDTKVSKRKAELVVEPEVKRSRSQSPCVADVKLPPFTPNNPLGQEFVVPKSGFFCNLCRVFYLSENVAKEVHCSGQKHYDNLQKHYQKLQHKPSGRPTPDSHGSLSD